MVSGLRAWLVQRISAVCMLAFIALVLIHFLFDPPHSYQAWRAWIMRPAISIATFALFGALLLHTWVGVRDVLIDYIHPVALRVVALALLGFGLAAMAAWVARILLMAHG